MARTTRRTTAGNPTRTRLAAGTLGAALVAGATLAGSAPAGVSDPPATPVPGASDPTSVGWYSHRDQTPARFAATSAEHSRAGFLPVDLDIDTVGVSYRVASVWQKNTDGRVWRALRDLSAAGFADAEADTRGDGLRLVEQETYVLGGARRYAGVWIADTENLAWTSHRGQTPAQFASTLEANRRAGLMPVDLDQYAGAHGMRYSTVWVENRAGTAWKLYRGLTSAGFSERSEANPGHRLLSFESVRTPAGQRYGAIFVEDLAGRRTATRRDLDARAYENHWHRHADLGYRVVGMDRYPTAAGPRYAVTWRQNSARPDWALRAAVDARVKQELDAGETPGIAVAVYQNGAATYLRGFGHADVAAGEWMDAGHVGSIASVSKGVAGVLTMTMVRQGLLSLADATRAWVPTMPAGHRHTVGQLLANRGCVRHYNGTEASYADAPYATALEASGRFWDDALVAGCSYGDHVYSTHGYTLLGAALEAAGGDDVKDLVRKQLTAPHGLGTLGPQDLSSSVRRMAIYGPDGAEIDTYDNGWKVLGGGLDSSVADLAGFGAKLSAGQILAPEDLATLFTPPDGASGYAYGWNTGTEDGTPVVAKDGAFDGYRAYLRMYPEKGVVVAVMMNSRDGGASATGLGQAVGSMVLDGLRRATPPA